MADQPSDLISALKAKLESIRDNVTLDPLRDDIRAVSEKVEQRLPESLKSLRERGYQYRAHLDENVHDLVSQWQPLHQKLEAKIEQESRELRKQFESMRDYLSKLIESDQSSEDDGNSGRRLKLQRESEESDKEDEKGSSRLASRMRASKQEQDGEDTVASSTRRLHLSREQNSDDEDAEGSDAFTKAQKHLSNLEERVKTIESDVQAHLEDVTKAEYDITRQISTINWYLEQFEDASFDLESNEALVMVAKAEWVQSGKGKEDPDGILYLTNQRLIFEQKEKVGKRFGLFGGQKVQDVVWEFKVRFVENLEHENRGMLGGKDIIHLTVSEGAPMPVITIEVKGGADNKAWIQEIQRVMSNEIENERIR